MRWLGFLLAGMCALLSVDVAAQSERASADGGVVNAVAYQPMPTGAAIMVRPLDNSDINLTLVKIFETALREKGFTIAKDAALILSFDTGGEIGAWSDAGRRSIVELQARGGREGTEDAYAIVNIFNSSRGGLLNEGHGGTSITTPSQIRVDATVEDRSNGRRLWHGWTIANLAYGDREALTRAMVPILTGNLGQTVSRQPFKIP
jgi:hypothetical protein